MARAKLSCTQFPQEYLKRMLGKKHAAEADDIINTIVEGGLSDVHTYYDDGVVVCGTTAERKRAREEIKGIIRHVKDGREIRRY